MNPPVPMFETIAGRFGIEVERSGPQSVRTWVPMLPELRDAQGRLRTSAILMGIDMAQGVAAGLGALPAWSVTADAEVRFVAPCHSGPLRIDAECVRAGRTMSIAQARLVDEGDGDRLVALSSGNHGLRVPEFAPALASLPLGERHAFPVPEHPAGQTVETYFEVAQTATEARIPLSEKSRNPWGFLHGGLHGLLIDRVAQGAGLTDMRDLLARFMNPVREGDAVATVTERTEREQDTLLRIEVHDAVTGRLAVAASVTGLSAR